VTRPRHLAAQAAWTGLWLGLQQVALGFALMAGAGGTAILFFAFLAAWIAGGAVGAAWGRRPRLSLAAAFVLAVAARLALEAWPFTPLSIAVTLAAGAASGAYAGLFLRERAPAWGDPRRLLLWENNGFVSGYALAGILLFWSSHVLEGLTAVLGLLLFADRLRSE